MLAFLAVLCVVVGFYALLFSLLPGRLAGVLVTLSLVPFGYLWTMPRYYLLPGGNDSVVINEERTGRSWTYTPPVYFGAISHLGKFAASLMAVGLALGGVIAYKVRQERAWRNGELPLDLDQGLGSLRTEPAEASSSAPD